MWVRWIFLLCAGLITAAALRPSGRAYRALADGVAVIHQSGAPQRFLAGVRGATGGGGYLEALFPAGADAETRRAMEELAAEVGAPRRRTDLRMRHKADSIDRLE